MNLLMYPGFRESRQKRKTHTPEMVRGKGKLKTNGTIPVSTATNINPEG
jgi:hypothetical protein